MNKPSTFTRLAIGLVSASLLAACAASTPARKIDTQLFTAPKTVAIMDFPPLNTAALIAPPFHIHFNETSDPYFLQANVADGKPIGISARSVISPVGGLVGGLMLQGAESTQERAQSFSKEILKIYPKFDLRADVMRDLRGALEASGIAVSIITPEPLTPPRLRWPTADTDHRGPVQPEPLAEPVDADLLLQISPMAYYAALGPTYGYRRHASIGVALYKGRTRQFLGTQTLLFHGPDSNYGYLKYDTLVEGLPEAAPALRAALLSLIPQIVDIVNARSPGTAPQAGPSTAAALPAPTDAPVPVPYLKQRGQARYLEFLNLGLPRAFAISDTGHFAMASGKHPKDPAKSPDPKERALLLCKESAGKDCVLYAVDKRIVFEP